eukprot:Seg1508.9 transcript_id=Seg1508.9/GoldUCD/mRNA.D3Y31 product="Glycogen-binding subunit 76A" protein_id=Seg1508.9/GoldUCD/D3Y31
MKVLATAEKLQGKSVYCFQMAKTASINDYEIFREKKASILVRRSKSVNGTEETSSADRCERIKITPLSPKKVTFADSNGLDLVEVNKFVDDLSEWSPCRQGTMRPRSCSAPVRLCGAAHTQDQLILPCFSLKLCFELPRSEILDELVERNSICLEHATFHGRWLTLVCRVKNHSFVKAVYVRFTFDNWESFTERHGTHISHSLDGLTDRFELKIHAPKRVRELNFALRYQADGMEFWDNNKGRNYVVQSSSL